MVKIRCKCGREDCTQELELEYGPTGPQLWLKRSDGIQANFYLDANDLVTVIHEARRLLLQMTQAPEEEVEP